MLAWKAQGAAIAADLSLSDGRHAKAVIVADRQNPRGLAFLIHAEGTQLTPASLGEIGDLLDVGQYIELIVMQERAFGTAGLPKPELVP